MLHKDDYFYVYKWDEHYPYGRWVCIKYLHGQALSVRFGQTKKEAGQRMKGKQS